MIREQTITSHINHSEQICKEALIRQELKSETWDFFLDYLNPFFQAGYTLKSYTHTVIGDYIGAHIFILEPMTGIPLYTIGDLPGGDVRQPDPVYSNYGGTIYLMVPWWG